MGYITKIHEDDNVAVALMDLEEGERVKCSGHAITVKEHIRAGHKIAIAGISRGGHVIKYGNIIGIATKMIRQGESAHTHNIKSRLGQMHQYKYEPKFNNVVHKNDNLYFNGYRRRDGRVGIRNELFIIPTVVCVNSVGDKIASEFNKRVTPSSFGKATVLKHTLGCAQSEECLLNTQNILVNISKNPNAGGVLFLGLGCEDNHIKEIKYHLGDYDNRRIRFLNAQDTKNEVEQGVILLKELYSIMCHDNREKTSLSELNVGLECGGSDGFSGLTANILLGRFSDYLVSQGGAVVLTEVPEMFGAETILMERAKNKKIFNKIVKMINGYKKYLNNYSVPIYENPSYGNKEGGITTLEEKSLGCIQKGGNSIITDVIEHSGVLMEKGLNLYNCPSDDAIQTTMLGAIGCQMVLFTTGRGTPLGGFIPTIKISTTTRLANYKNAWIDFDAGRLIGTPIELLIKELTDLVIDTANGKNVLNEINNYKEVSLWKIGPTV